MAVFLIIGACTLGFAGWKAWRTIGFVRSALAAPGTILPDSPDSVGTVTAGHPLVQFRTQDGRDVVYRQNGMSSQRVGARVSVLYRAEDPAGSATVDGVWTLWGTLILSGTMGLGFLVLPLLGFEIGPRLGRW